METWQQYKARLPRDVDGWLEEQAKRNGSSKNSEIIRSVRDRMEAAGHVASETSPAAT